MKNFLLINLHGTILIVTDYHRDFDWGGYANIKYVFHSRIYRKRMRVLVDRSYIICSSDDLEELKEIGLLEVL